MFTLKPVSTDAIPAALAKAERYRLLNEPREAESICRDILVADPHNQPALICLILAQTDLFTQRQGRVNEVREMTSALKDPFAREYFTGVVEERWGKSLLQDHHAVDTVYAALLSAMEHFERAESLAPPGNDDPILRWNTCVRLLQRLNYTPPQAAALDDSIIDEDMPMR